MKLSSLPPLLALLLLLPLVVAASDYEAGAVVLKRGGAAAATAEPAAAPAATDNAAAVEKSGIATRLGFGRPADDVERIAPSQGRFHPWLKITGAKAGQTVECKLIFKSQSGDIEAASAKAKTDAEGTAICNLAPPKGTSSWPEGDYGVEFHHGGGKVHERRLQVGG